MKLVEGFQSAKTVNIIRGRNLVDKASQNDVSILLAHIDALEGAMDNLDCEDAFGTEGWRHYFEVPK